jgi:hypothetical protein
MQEDATDLENVILFESFEKFKLHTDRLLDKIRQNKLRFTSLI